MLINAFCTDNNKSKTFQIRHELLCYFSYLGEDRSDALARCQDPWVHLWQLVEVVVPDDVTEKGHSRGDVLHLLTHRVHWGKSLMSLQNGAFINSNK